MNERDIQKAIDRTNGLERRLGNFPARWAKFAGGSDFAFGRVYLNPIERNGKGQVKIWKFNAGLETISATTKVVDVLDVGIIDAEQTPVGHDTPILIQKVQGHWIVLDFNHQAIDFEAKLEEPLTRGGEANAQRLYWDGNSWEEEQLDSGESSSGNTTILIHDIHRIPIGKKLDTDDQIGVRRIGTAYFLGDYDCEDLIDA